MYRLLKSDNLDVMATLAKTWRGQPIFCDLCFNSFQRKAGIHGSISQQAQYISALKYLLAKKTKKVKKSKRFVEVVKGTDNKLVNAKASVDVIRGKKLTILANNLAMLAPPAQNLNAKRPYAVDSTRHYDPLLVLPVESANSADHLSSSSNHSRTKTEGENASLPNIKFPFTIPVHHIITEYKKNTNENDIHRYVDITPSGTDGNPPAEILKEPKIQDLFKMNYFTGSDLERFHRAQLRKKLRLKPLFELQRELKTIEVEGESDGTVAVLNETIFSKTDVEDEASLEQFNEGKKNKKRKPSIYCSLKQKTREAIAKQKLSDLERKAKQESLNANFLSYSDVCIYTGMVNDAFTALKSYRRRISTIKEWHPSIANIEIYNRIICGFAKEGNWNKINELLCFAKDDGLNFNAQTYAGILDCLGRWKHKNASHIKPYLAEIIGKGMEVSSVLNQTTLSLESQKNILDAIRTVDANFTPLPNALDVNYDCALLNHLNDRPSNFSSPLPTTLDASIIKQFYYEQTATEKNNYVKIKTIEKRAEPRVPLESFRKKLAEAERQWKITVEKSFDRDLEILKMQSKHKSHFFFTIYPYLMTLPKEDHVEIVMQEIRKLAEGSETYSPTTKQLYRELGAQVFSRYQIKKKANLGALHQLDELFSEYCDWYANPDGSAANTRQKWQLLLQKHTAAMRLSHEEPMWKSHVLTGVGRFLYNIIIRDVKIDVNILRLSSKKEHFLPAFYTLFRNKGHTCKEEVKPHPTLSRLYRAAAPEHLVFEASKIPMVCPPLPWTAINSGGYLLTKTELIRLPYQAVAQWKELEATPVNKLYPAFDSLNQLGAVPWTVNEEVLDVVLTVFNSGGSAKLDVPEPPSSCPAPEPVSLEMTQAERAHIYRQRMAVRRRRAEMYSLWCDALYKLSLANHFRKRVFWLPHNMDFRGRVYPVAPHLNHLGSDLSRALLVFAKGQPLGDDGINWLKIHTINLTGTHKRKSIEERLEFANSIIDDIIDSAERPLTGRMWWAKSEEPWQTLAACMEVRNALVSGDPASYMSRFPVHQDGSCNGLQHYAALGRDQAGGESVNLTPATVPQDVYSCVAAIVERERAKDAANGVTIAKELEGFIYRKVIKQTVMTTVYGVTRFGARLQIARQLKDLDDFPKQHVWQASMYLVNKTFDSLQEMFTSTKEIQDWFTECARLIAQVCGENVQWLTPLGLPIVQPYSRNTNHLNTADHIKFIGVQASSLADAFERPNIMKQKNAFAPNFIHSLDSSHMMLTSIICEYLGVTFVSVHDCYWTHACSVPAMNRVCRDQFVALHSHPILAELSDYFAKRFAYSESCFFNDGSVADLARRNLNRVLRDLPSTGSLDLNAVLKSPYFFS